MHKLIDDKRRVVFLLWGLLFVGFLAVSIISYQASRNAVRDAIVVSELPLTVDNIYSEIQKDLIRPVFISSMMASDTFFRDWVLGGEQDVDKLSRYLQEIKQNYDTFSSFFVSEQTRTYYYPGGRLKQVDASHSVDDWYFRVRKMHAPYEINVDPDAANANALTIFVNYRVKDYDGRFIGATGVGLTVDAVKTLINYYQEKYQRGIYFVDRNGRIVLFGSKSQPPDSSIREHPGLRDIADRALSQPLGSYQYHDQHGNMLLNVRYVPELDWYLFVERNEDDALRDIRHAFYFNLLIAAVIGAALLFISVAIGRYQKRMEQIATSDSLTRLPNRQAFEVVADTFMQGMKRSGEALSMLLIDIDHFKQVNDRHGHIVGDQVLVAVADGFRANLREADFICRWGGEEFLVLLKNCDVANAMQLGEKLRAAIAALNLESGGEPLRLTVSIGVAQWQQGESVNALIERADVGLYQAKLAGRNRIQSA